MPRIRTTKPEYWSREQTAAVSHLARLAHLGMLNFADDCGIHPASVRQLKLEVFPGDELPPGALEAAVGELETAGMLATYETGGETYWRILTWSDQRIDHPQPPRYPDPTNPDAPAPKGMPLLEQATGAANAAMTMAAGPKCATVTATPDPIPAALQPAVTAPAGPKRDTASDYGNIPGTLRTDGKGEERKGTPLTPQGEMGGELLSLESRKNETQAAPTAEAPKTTNRQPRAPSPTIDGEAVARLLKAWCSAWGPSKGQEASPGYVRAAAKLVETHGPNCAALVPAVVRRIERVFKDCQSLAGAAKHFAAAAEAQAKANELEALRRFSARVDQTRRERQLREAAERRDRLERARAHWERLDPNAKAAHLEVTRRASPWATGQTLEMLAVERLAIETKNTVV